MKKIFTILSFGLLFNLASFSQNDTLVMWTFPSGELADTLPDIHNEANTNSFVFTEGASEITMKNGLTTKAAQATEWQDGADAKSWQIKMNTTAYQSLELSVKLTAGGSNPGPRDFKTQYRVGVDGVWVDIEGGELTVLNDWTTGVINDLSLPVDCEDASELFIRFVMTSNISADGTDVLSTGTSKIEDILIKGNLISGLNIVQDVERKLFPNPSKGTFIIESNSVFKSIIIYSATGQIVFSKFAESTQEEINLNVPNGIYFVEIENMQNKKAINRLIIQ